MRGIWDRCILGFVVENSRSRVLEASRLSRLDDRTGSRRAIGLERRSEEVARYCLAYGLNLVHVAEDTDVSGSVDPFERPQLGKYLTRPDSFDIIMAADLDRVGRSARHLTRLRDWCEDTGHKLVVLSPHLEWPPERGDLASPIIWDVLGRLAEYELNAIIKRNRGTRQWLIDNGAITGKPLYGYRTTGPEGARTLEIDPVTSLIVKEAVKRYLKDKESLENIAYDFNRRGVPSPGKPTKKLPNPKWSAGGLARILKNEGLTGRKTQTYVNDDGKKVSRVVRYPGIITVSEHQAIVQQMTNRSSRRGVAPYNKTMLTGVLFCGHCSGPMYRTHGGSFSNPLAYYHCRNKNCSNRKFLPMIPTDMKVLEKVTEFLGDQRIYETVIIPGKDYEEEISHLKMDLAMLDPEDEDWTEKVTEIREEIVRFRSLRVELPKEVSVPTEQFSSDEFADADPVTRRGILVRAGIKFYATQENGETVLRMEVKK